MILEGLVTTVSPTGQINLAPMGPRVFPDEMGHDGQMRRFLLRPFQTAQTYRNLLHHGEGVLHLTDDVLLLAQAALGVVGNCLTYPLPPVRPAGSVRGWVLEECCQYYEFRVASVDSSQQRAELEAEVVAQGRCRAFLGFNRARHAVIEAAILATRLHLLPVQEIETEYHKLAVIVEKTGAERERQAFALLQAAVERRASVPEAGPT